MITVEQAASVVTQLHDWIDSLGLECTIGASLHWHPEGFQILMGEIAVFDSIGDDDCTFEQCRANWLEYVEELMVFREPKGD